MKNKVFITGNIFLAFVVLCFLSSSLLADYGTQKAVYHINGSDSKQQIGGLRNIQNHINAVGKDKIDIKVVLHGAGLTLLLFPDAQTKFKRGNADDNMQARVAALKDQGVQFLVCANTLKGKNVKYDQDLYDVEKLDIVPSGVAHLSYLQARGYTYIKP